MEQLVWVYIGVIVFVIAGLMGLGALVFLAISKGSLVMALCAVILALILRRPVFAVISL